MKDRKGTGRKAVAFAEMFLLVSLSFAVAFFFEENRVAADAAASTTPPAAPPEAPVPATAPAPAAPAAASVSILQRGAVSHQFGVGSETLGGWMNPDRISGVVQLQNGQLQAVTWNSEQNTWVTQGSPFAGTGTATNAPATGGGSTSGGIMGLFQGSAFGVEGVGGVLSSLTSGLIWGAVVYAGAYFLAQAFGQTPKQAQSIALAAGGGTFVGTSLYFMASHGTLGTTLAANAGLFGLLTGVGVGVAILLATYKKEKKEIVQFICEPWQPPYGGNKCDECNKDPQKPCSTYRCKALGQACNIVNKGTDKELCVWTNKDDVTAPIISPWDEALKPTGLRTVKDGTGYRIVDSKDPRGCLQPFSRLEFGVRTDEPSQCRVDINANATYDQMGYLFGDSVYDYMHAQTNFRVPQINQIGEEGEVPTIHNNGVFTLFVRCVDANGNGKDSQPFAVKFCVGAGPDTTPPVIEGFSISDGSPVRYQVDKVPIEVYTNEPSECKWSKRDQDFNTMENTMECATSTYQISSQLNYVCSGDLTGVQDRQNNDFYFRCKDQPNNPKDSERNVMRVSRKLTLKGTEPLVINSVGPTGTIKGGTTTVGVNLTVTTAFGSNDGAATCFYENSPDGQFNIAMLGSETAANYQPIELIAGTYTYYFKCIDAGGNLAENQTSFKIDVDTTAPVVLRAFKDGPNLKLITSEEAKCVYSLDRCDYDFTTGIPLKYEDATSGKRVTHLVEWSTDKTYYIKCEDYQGKRVSPNQCTIIVQGSEL